MHHAFVIEAEAQEGIGLAQKWVKENLGMECQGNPDVVLLQFGLFSADDARRVCEGASQAPFVHDSKAIIITASRAYHEAQNGLLKLFEEPPPSTYLFFIMPSLGSLLPTLRSRVQVLAGDGKKTESSEAAAVFMKASKEKRSALIKKLASGRDEEDRRENRDEAVAIVSGVEATLREQGLEKNLVTLQEIQTLRTYLHDRSAPVKMILEHLSLVLPKGK